MNRYEGNVLNMYFYKGSFEERFNIVAIAFDLKVHNGKLYEYEIDGEKKEEKFRGFNDMYNRISDEALADMKSRLMDVYTNNVMNFIEPEDEEEEKTEEITETETEE